MEKFVGVKAQPISLELAAGEVRNIAYQANNDMMDKLTSFIDYIEKTGKGIEFHWGPDGADKKEWNWKYRSYYWDDEGITRCKQIKVSDQLRLFKEMRKAIAFTEIAHDSIWYWNKLFNEKNDEEYA